MIFILTCSLPPPCKGGRGRTFSCVLTCFFSLGLSIPYAFLKRAAFYRSFCQSRNAGGLLFLGLKWRSSFAAGFFSWVQTALVGVLWLTKVTKKTSSKTGWGCSCACESGWCPVLQSHRVSFSLWPLPAGECLWVVQGLTPAWSSQVGMQPLLWGREFSHLWAVTWGLILLAMSCLCSYISEWLRYILCAHLQGILGLSAGERNQNSFVDLTVSTSLNIYTKSSLNIYTKRFWENRSELLFQNTCVCVKTIYSVGV